MNAPSQSLMMLPFIGAMLFLLLLLFMAEVGVPENLKFGHWGNSYPAHLIDHNNKTLLGLDEDSRQNLALLTPGKLLA